MIRVWLPGQDAAAQLGSLPAGLAADIWDVPQAGPRAMAIVRDQLARYASGEPLRNIVGDDGY